MKLLPIILAIIILSCKGKEKHYQIDLITKSGGYGEGHFYFQGTKLSDSGYTARYQFIRPSDRGFDTTIFYFMERDGKAQKTDKMFAICDYKTEPLSCNPISIDTMHAYTRESAQDKYWVDSLKKTTVKKRPHRFSSTGYIFVAVGNANLSNPDMKWTDSCTHYAGFINAHRDSTGNWIIDLSFQKILESKYQDQKK